jgi:hypothetical protein
MSARIAGTDHPIHELLANRWSPYAFSERAVSEEDLLSCLVDGNQTWAKAVPVLALGIARTRFERNDPPNPAAKHDLGAASAYLTFEATPRRGAARRWRSSCSAAPTGEPTPSPEVPERRANTARPGILANGSTEDSEGSWRDTARVGRGSASSLPGDRP